MGSVSDLVVSESTTVRNLTSYFSDPEVACIRDAIGAAIFDVILDAPLLTLPGAVGDFPFQCLGMESAIGLSVAFMSSEAGGLGADTRSCIVDVATENPSVFGIAPPPPAGEFAGLVSGALQIALCLTDEEALALAGDEDQLPPPSVLRCMEEELGSFDDLLPVLAGLLGLPGEAPAADALLRLVGAAQACGVDLEATLGGASTQ